MKLDLELNNKIKNPLKKAWVTSVVERTIAKSGLKFGRKKISLSVAVVGKSEIKKLNRIYRGKNAPTDILSFTEYKTQANLKKARGNDIFLGELVICYDDVKDWAKNQNLELRDEIGKVAVHGTLHLLGFVHGKKMLKIQEKILGRCAPAYKNTNPATNIQIGNDKFVDL